MPPRSLVEADALTSGRQCKPIRMTIGIAVVGTVPAFLVDVTLDRLSGCSRSFSCSSFFPTFPAGDLSMPPMAPSIPRFRNALALAASVPFPVRSGGCSRALRPSTSNSIEEPDVTLGNRSTLEWSYPSGMALSRWRAWCPSPHYPLIVLTAHSGRISDGSNDRHTLSTTTR